ncbi:MAG: BMC domain-containing protein [Elainellaceae cyanobacterium]
MPIAVGVIETHGLPASMLAADAMIKAGRVTFVRREQADSGRHFVVIRGPVAEVKRAMEAGKLAASDLPYNGQVTCHCYIPNPTPNTVSVMPIDFTENSEPFRVL